MRSLTNQVAIIQIKNKITNLISKLIRNSIRTSSSIRVTVIIAIHSNFELMRKSPIIDQKRRRTNTTSNLQIQLKMEAISNRLLTTITNNIIKRRTTSIIKMLLKTSRKLRKIISLTKITSNIELSPNKILKTSLRAIL